MALIKWRHDAESFVGGSDGDRRYMVGYMSWLLHFPCYCQTGLEWLTKERRENVLRFATDCNG
jgi:hypothetical protein